MSISVLAISFDARNAARLAQFWAQALHRSVNDGATEDFASVAADTDGRLGPFLMFHKAPEGKTAKKPGPLRPPGRPCFGGSRPADKPRSPADPLVSREQQPLDQFR
jgi:hypothetical protein